MTDFEQSARPAPEISVIVVTYRQEETLARTLDSVLAQRLDAPFEVLVWDDCSPDSTADVARTYATRFPDIVRVHVNEHNRGVQANYFDALRNACASLIADCAGDDFWTDPLKLQKQLDILRDNPAISLVHTAFNLYYPDGSAQPFIPAAPRQPLETGHDALRKILVENDEPFIHLCSSLYRRGPILRALDEMPHLFLDPEYRCEDLQVECAAAAAGDIAYIPQPTLAYSQGHSSISSEDNFAKTFDFYFGTTRLRLELIRHYGISDRDAAPVMARYVDFLMSQAFHFNSRSRALRLINWAKAEGIPLPAKTRLYRRLLFSPVSRPASAIIRARRRITHKQ